MRKKKIFLFVMLLTCLAYPAATGAENKAEDEYQRWGQPLVSSVSGEKVITVTADETIDDNFVRFGDTITILGEVNGDVIVGGGDITIDGRVGGDIIAAGENITINGPVSGNVRVAAAEVTINGPVGKNINIAAAKATITETASVGWTFSFLTAETTISGPIMGSIYGYGGEVNLNSTVGSNVTLLLDERGQVTPGSSTKINGNLQYRANTTAQIDSGAVIRGETVRKPIPASVNQAKKFLNTYWLYAKLIGLFGLLLVGTVLISLASQKSTQLSDQLTVQPGRGALWGFLLTFGTPLVAIFLSLTLIGIPLAAILMALYLFLLYVSKVFIGLLVGRKILRSTTVSPIWPMMLGTLIVFTVCSIPRIGWIFSMACGIWFLGTVFQTVVRQQPAQPKPSPAAPPPPAAKSSAEKKNSPTKKLS